MKTLSTKQNFLGIEKKFSSFENSKVVILPIPYEKTVSYGSGTKFGPKNIIEASHFVEFYDEEMEKEIYKEIGIATVSEINFKNKNEKESLTLIYETAKKIIQQKKFLLSIGGEHTISQSLIKAHFEKYPKLSVLQIDAHSDLRQEYQGNKFSHASVMARVCEFLSPQKLVQVGIRAQSIEEAKMIREKKINTFYAHQISSSKNWIENILKKLSDEVYLTFDVDGLDPSIMPSTGTPEPNGLLWNDTMLLLKEIGKKKKIIGADVVEFSPNKFLHYPNETAAKLVYKILNYSFIN